MAREHTEQCPTPSLLTPGLQPPAAVSIKMQKPEAGRVELAEVSSLAACRRIRSTVDSPALRQIQGPFSTALVLCVLRLALPVDTPQGFETPTSGMKTSPRSSHLGQGGQLVDHPLSCCCPYCPSSVKVQSGGWARHSHGAFMVGSSSNRYDYCQSHILGALHEGEAARQSIHSNASLYIDQILLGLVTFLSFIPPPPQ